MEKQASDCIIKVVVIDKFYCISDKMDQQHALAPNTAGGPYQYNEVVLPV